MARNRAHGKTCCENRWGVFNGGGFGRCHMDWPFERRHYLRLLGPVELDVSFPHRNTAVRRGGAKAVDIDVDV